MPEQSHSIIIILNCESVGGVHGEDEQPGTYEFAYLVYDRSQNKILSSLEKIIEPAAPERRDLHQQQQSTHSSNEESSETLRDIFHQLNQHLDNPYSSLATFGVLSLRHFIHSHAIRDKIKLHDKFYSYFDIEEEFKQTYPEYCSDDTLDLVKIATYLNIDLPAHPHGLRRCRLIAEVMQQLPNFPGSPQTIQSQYSNIPSSAPLVDETIVRIRGFSAITTDVKLARFFAGLNIESGGIVMCPSPHGRPTTEALVRFTDKPQRNLALKRNGTKFGTRLMEVCPATVQEYSKISDQDNMHCVPNALENFLVLAAPPVAIIRMRGLPYNSKASEIIAFFGEEPPVYRGNYGIFFVHHADRRPTGDAFVLFETAEQGKQALTKDRQTIGKRYVELFQTSRNEVVQVFTRYSLPTNGLPFTPVRPLRLPDHVAHNKNFASNTKHIIRLRGLPYSATVQDILDFLNDFSKYVNPAGVHMVYNLQGRPSGDAFIELRSAEHAQKASELLHKKHIGERYIEVFQCSPSEMTFMVMYGIPSFRQHNSWINGPYSPHTPPHVPTTFTYPPVSTTAYPAVSSPSTITPNSPHCSMISVPSSPTVSPTPRVFMTSPSPGYVTYSSPPFFNFTAYPTSVDAASIGHTQSVVSPTPYDAAVFFPGYQAVNDYTVGHMDPHFIPVNPYLPPTNGYYPPTETDSRRIPAYVETYSG